MAKQAKNFWIGFDLGGTKMLATVFNRSFKPVASFRRKTRGQQGAAAGVKRVIETITGALNAAKVEPVALGGIGVGVPGPIAVDAGKVLEMPNLGWRNVNVKAALEKAFGCPVVVANDVDAGVYGEYLFGAGRGARCVLGVFPGTGIGGGCVYDGQILRGSTLSCLEIGHMAVQPDGPLCGCGQRGCLEAVASRLAIASAAAAAAYRGEAPHLLELTAMNLADIRSSALAAAVRKGDAAVEQIVRQAAQWLGVGIASVVNVLLPDVVLLGGGLVQEMPVLFRSEVQRVARSRVMAAYRKSFTVRTAELGDAAATIGAAAWARQVLESGGGRAPRGKRK